MDPKILSTVCDQLVPRNYLNIALESRNSRGNIFRILLEKRKLPDTGWGDDLIEEFISYLSSLDSNNFQQKSGVGEREARIACRLVARRHYNFAHGIGRSGDLLEPQPKAAGSSLMSQLTNALTLDLIRSVGILSTKYCFIVPMATGMTLNLCFLALRKKRPQAKYILWSRIDQKSCFKSMTTAGFVPIIIPLAKPQKSDGLATNIPEFQKRISELKSEEILCIYSTTSCFAPRLCDDVVELAKLARTHEIPHIINNAYGLQSTFITHQIEQANKNGRVDIFVQSTDKNLMVPVGGAIVAGFNEDCVKEVAKSYVGRASSSQTLDVLMTLLSLGKNEFLRLVAQRKDNFKYLSEQLGLLAKSYGEQVYNSKGNPISLALTLQGFEKSNITKLGSMLFTRGISGARVISCNEIKTIDGYSFQGWGSHSDDQSIPYLTAAASIGQTKEEVDIFIKKLDKCLKILKT